MSVDTGVTLGGRYRLTERLATGGMGEVWRARDERLDRDVAVKVLKAEYAEDPSFRDRFRAEARHTAALTHHGIAAVHDYGEDGRTAYLVMDLINGEPLSAILAREGHLPVERTLDVVAQAADALDAAHQAGVVHRDVKPGNILVCADGTVKVTDFGIARAADAVPLTRTGMILGTAQYLSPEQGHGRPTTPASDVYSLGVVTYECLAGRPPFDADTPVGVAMAHLYDDPVPLPPEIPEPVAALVTKALAKDPADRYPSAAAFAAAARAARGDAPLVAPTQTLVLPAVIEGGWRPSRQQTYVALALAAAALLGLLFGITHGSGSAPHQPKPTPSAHTGPQPVRLPAGLIGQPVTQVRATLTTLGLHVRTQGTVSDRRFGTVVAVSPSTGLRQGDTVTVTYSLGKPREEHKRHGKGEHGD